MGSAQRTGMEPESARMIAICDALGTRMARVWAHADKS
jgi:hypothetical protein